MGLKADYLRDAHGRVLKVYPTPSGELRITSNQLEGEPEWTEPTYTIPDEPSLLDMQTLRDRDGKTWYLYPVPSEELAISDTNPNPGLNALGVWQEPDYDAAMGQVQRPVEQASIIHYVTYRDADGKYWYAYPDENGELTITENKPD